jgi:WD40 repeat protein
MITGTVEIPGNPFPGLRPFQDEESHLFFGREGLSEELLSRLCETRFLAVVGTSGSGKSSLVRAGLLPALRGGLMVEAGSDWRVAILRPGNGPIGELARVLNDPKVLGRTIDENEEAQRIIIESSLRRGSLGLVDIVRQAKMSSLLFKVNDLKAPASLVTKLKEGTDPVSEYLRSRFSKATLELLNPYHGPKTPDPALLDALVNELNNLLADTGLYQAARFQHVELSSEIQQLIPQQSKANLMQLNRRLLEEAYLHKIAIAPEENLLIIVDQFEELFRYSYDSSKPQFVKRAPFSASDSRPLNKPVVSNNGKGLQPPEAAKYENEAAAFVNLLLEASRQKASSVFVVITMRSDYLGDCAQFEGLPEAINEGQYLVPRLTREQQRKAITGPIAVFEAEITPRLVNQLLNDMGDDPDQLPLLQHALMRTWKKAEKDSKDVKSLDFHHYRTVGGMADALSKHLEDAYEELSDKQKEIAEKLFKCLTVEAPGGQQIRRPTVLKEICEIIEEKGADIIDVIEVFRRPGRSFLMPPVNESLKIESQIDISHESLIRCWQRLKSWVDEEAKSASDYQRLADTAMLYDINRAELLRDPEAHFALKWYEESNPNEAWAKRYHEADFSVVKNFLEKSRELLELLEKEKEQRQKELEDKEKQRRKVILRKFVKALTYTLSVASFLLLAVFIFTLLMWREAKSQLDVVNQQQHEVTQQLGVAQHRDYAAQMAVAQSSYTQGDYAAANEKLNWLRYYIESEFKKSLNDFAGFEWYHLLKLCQNEADTLPGQPDGPLYSVAFQSRDGRRIAAGTRTGRVRVWEKVNNKWEPPRELNVSPGADVKAIAFSPADENKLATGSADGSVRLWSLSAGELSNEVILQQANPQEKPVLAVAFSPDGRMLAAGGEETDEKEAMSVWNIESGERFSVSMHKGIPDRFSVRSIAFSPKDTNLLAIGTTEGVKLFRRETDKDIKNIAFKEIPNFNNPTDLEKLAVNSVAFSPVNTNILAIGASDSKLRLLDISTSDMITLEAHGKEISSVVFSKNGDRLATGSYDGSVRLWDTSNNLALIKKEMEANPQNPFLSLKPALRGHAGYVNSIAFLAEEETLVGVSNDGTAKLWRTTGMWQEINEPDPSVLRLEAHEDAILSLAYSPNGERLVLGSADKRLNLLSIRSLMRERRKQGERDPQKLPELLRNNSSPQASLSEVSSVAISRSGNLLASGYWDGSVRLWHLSKDGQLSDATPLQLNNPEERILSVSFSRDEKFLAAGLSDKNNREVVKVWQLEPRRLLTSTEGGSCVAFSPVDENLLAIGGGDHTVRLWNVQTRELLNLKPLADNGHTKRILSVLFSPDGKILASGSADNTAILWNVAAREQMITLEGHSDPISSLAFSSQGERLATGSYDGSVKLWNTGDQIWRAKRPLELTTLKALNAVISLAFSPNDRTLVAGGGDGSLFLWYTLDKDDVSKLKKN